MLGHEFQGVGASWWMLGHLARAIEFVAAIEKFFVIAFADELIEFGFGEGLLIEIARNEIGF